MNNDKKNAMNKGQRTDSSNAQENKKSDNNQQTAGANLSKFDKQNQSDNKNKKDNNFRK